MSVQCATSSSIDGAHESNYEYYGDVQIPEVEYRHDWNWMNQALVPASLATMSCTSGPESAHPGHIHGVPSGICLPPSISQPVVTASRVELHKEDPTPRLATSHSNGLNNGQHIEFDPTYQLAYPPTSSLLAPSAQLPTPAAMAVLLNQGNKFENGLYTAPTPASSLSAAQNHIGPQLPSLSMPIRVPRPLHRKPEVVNHHQILSLPATASLPVSNTHNTSRSEHQSREKKHACSMCHKR